MKAKRFLTFLVAVCLIMPLAFPAWADTSYYRTLADRRITTWEDACRVMTIFLGKEKEYPDFEQQFEFLQTQGIIPKQAKPDAERVLRKGALALMVVRSLGIKGGVMMRLTQPLFGASGRYALKECVYLKLMESENEWDVVEGKELLSVLARMPKFKENKGVL